jgi:hypothetical protein
MRKVLGLGFVLIGLGVATAANAAPICAPLDLPVANAANSVTFQNAVSYSLPILGIDYKTGPGQLNNCVVIATGSSGGAHTINPAGFDNAYPTPTSTGGAPSFSTGNSATPPAAPNNVFAGQSPTTWDMQVGALEGYLGTGNSPIFGFNLNQVNSGDAENQSLFVWAQLVVKAADGTTVLSPYLYLAAETNGTGLSNFGVPGGNPNMLGTQTAATNTYPVGTEPTGTFPLGIPCDNAGGPSCGTSGQYMLEAQGQVCLNGPVGVGTVVPCGSPEQVGNPVNQNLGANDAAFAVVFPQLDALLPTLASTDVIQIDFRMGCNPDTVGPFVGPTSGQNGLTNCPLASPLNDGFEQAFIVPGVIATPVPEPSPIFVLGIGLLGLGFYARRGRG